MAWLEFGNAIFNVLLFVLAGWVVSLSLHEYAACRCTPTTPVTGRWRTAAT